MKSSIKELAKGMVIFSALSVPHVLRQDVLSVRPQSVPLSSLPLVHSNGVDGAPYIVSRPSCEDIRTVGAIRALAPSVMVVPAGARRYRG